MWNGPHCANRGTHQPTLPKAHEFRKLLKKHLLYCQSYEMLQTMKRSLLHAMADFVPLFKRTESLTTKAFRNALWGRRKAQVAAYDSYSSLRPNWEGPNLLGIRHEERAPVDSVGFT